MLTSAHAEFLTRLREWVPAFNAYIQPALDSAAREVVELREEAAASTSPISEPDSENVERESVPATASNVPPVTPAAHAPPPLPPSFPLRESSPGEKQITGREARANLGLPPLRDPRKKSELWQEVYAVSIPLPSSFDELVLERPAVASLVNWEKKVRQGQANDALSDLRTHLVTAEMLKIKKLDATGKASTTRMGKKIRRQNDQVVASADDYRRARLALTALGMKEDDPLFRPLKKADVVGFTMSTATQQLGESRKAVSWIWEDFSFAERPDDVEHHEFFEEGECIMRPGAQSLIELPQSNVFTGSVRARCARDGRRRSVCWPRR